MINNQLNRDNKTLIEQQNLKSKNLILKNTLNVNTNFNQGENTKIIPISTAKTYSKYVIKNPYINTFYSIYNISEKLNNNKFQFYVDSAILPIVFKNGYIDYKQKDFEIRAITQNNDFNFIDVCKNRDNCTYLDYLESFPHFRLDLTARGFYGLKPEFLLKVKSPFIIESVSDDAHYKFLESNLDTLQSAPDFRIKPNGLVDNFGNKKYSAPFNNSTGEYLYRPSFKNTQLWMNFRKNKWVKIDDVDQFWRDFKYREAWSNFIYTESFNLSQQNLSMNFFSDFSDGMFYLIRYKESTGEFQEVIKPVIKSNQRDQYRAEFLNLTIQDSAFRFYMFSFNLNFSSYKFEPRYYTNKTSELVLEDGYYTGYQINNFLNTNKTLSPYEYILEQIKETIYKMDPTFTKDNFKITLNQITNKLIIENKTDNTISISFTVPSSSTQSSSSLLLGFKNNLLSINPNTIVKSSQSIDVFSEGRLSNLKVNLLNFSSSGYRNESISLISIPASSLFGSLQTNYLQNFSKALPDKTILTNLSLSIVDNQNFQIDFSETIYLSFLIDCYDEE